MSVNPVVASKYWHNVPDKKVQCDLCPRRCRMVEGGRGFCRIRGCEAGKVSLLSYGYTSGFCADPIEKKPLFHFLPGTGVLSFGTAGCNLGCKFCQNWDISHSDPGDATIDFAEPHKIVRIAKQIGCAGVAFTYNDPVIFHEFAVDTAKDARTEGLRAIAVTAGYVLPEPREEFYKHMDAVNVDLKAFTDDFYKKYTDSSIEPVKETLVYIKKKTRVWLEITTLIIPGLNDSEKELRDMSEWIVKMLGPDVPLHLTAFLPSFKMMDHPYTTPELLIRSRETVLKSGLKFVYTGNIRDAKGQNTFCSGCRKALIVRNGYELGAWNLGADGGCSFCGTKCPGVFEERPGSWGSKRLPLTLSEMP